MLSELFSDPDSFFAQHAENPGLLRPLVVVLLAAIAALLSPLVTYEAFTNAGAPPFASISLAAGVILSFFGQFIVWVILAIVVYVLSIAVSGSGSLSDTFELLGWGFAPAVLAGVVTAIGNFLALQTVSVPNLPNTLNQSTAQQFTSALTEFQSAISSQPAVRIAALVAIVLLVWQGFLWMYGTKHARSLTTREAAIAVWIPVGIYVLYRLYILLSGWVF